MTKIPGYLSFICVPVLVASCATPVWNKPGATAQDLESDKYSCERDARQSGGFDTGIAGAIEVQEFFNRCLVAHGWEALGKDPSPRQIAIENQKQEVSSSVATFKMCKSNVRAKPGYAALGPYLPDLDNGDFTVRQLAESRKLSSAEKVAFESYLDEISACNGPYIASIQAINPKAADLLRDGEVEGNRVKASAIRGDISWGEMSSQLEHLQLDFREKARALKTS